ncbi:MAG: M28 family peptidase [Candidatus Latescibacteria bacterium]|nr:M28 family peptidase [Candidatus Latescibacterota bacterium]
MHRTFALVILTLAAVFSIHPASAQDAKGSAIFGFFPNELAAQQDWEAKFRAVPQPDTLRATMRWITEEPHHAGGPGSKKVAEYIVAKFKSWGLNAWIEPFEALLPTPVERRLQLLEPEQYTAALKEPPILQDKDSSDEGQLPTFNAYSPDGDVTAQVVYVNYGVPEDYETLDKLGIDVKGKIVLARYGRSWRGIKPRLAGERGAIGCLIYSDPADDGYAQGDILPEGAYRPWQGVQRGSTMDMPTYPGDPLSPGWASEKGAKKLTFAEARTLVKIPVLPISYGDAMPLLKNLRGPVAPEGWRGGLPLTYHVGPGPATVRLTLKFDWSSRPIYNVIARIDGSAFPDEWVIYGNHHDAWVNGADDPTSGNVALMETARGLATLLKQGWKPRRTIILASWDAEEWGLIGSTEWAEKHQVELREKAVCYINSDSNGKGWLGASGSHSLEQFVNEVARDVQDPKTGKSVAEALKERQLSQAKTDSAKKEIIGRPHPPIGALGSGSDYTVFLDFLTIASLNLGYGGDGGGGVYHSIYDSYDWYTRFDDTTFEYGKALSQTMGTAIMRLTNASILPFNFVDYATTIVRYLDEIEKEHKKVDGAPALDFAGLRTALATFKGSAERYDAAVRQALNKGTADAARLKTVNAILYKTERAFGSDKGLPKREWFKHQVYAPGLDTGYAVKTIPGVREGIDRRNWKEAADMIVVVQGVLNAAAKRVDEATNALGGP